MERATIQSRNAINVGDAERVISTIAGAALAIFGLRRILRGSVVGLALAAAGAEMARRGVTGNCKLYDALGKDTRMLDSNVLVEHAVTINRSPDELYRFWRDLANLPRFMQHLAAVEVLDDRRSRWTARAPAGSTVTWDAEITEDRPNEAIAWRSLDGSDVRNSGSVRFQAAPGGRGTVVRVALEYDPPLGSMGMVVAKLFGEEPELQVQADMRHLAQIMETGEIATTEGQPAGSSPKRKAASMVLKSAKQATATEPQPAGVEALRAA